VIWMLERRRAPATRQHSEPRDDDPPPLGRELALVLAGVALLAVGSIIVVEAVARVSAAESSQTDVSLTLVGLATTLELVVLAWATARRGATEAVIGAVVGSFAFNSTLSLGVAALVRPLVIVDAGRLRAPLVVMLAAFVALIALGSVRGRLGRTSGVALLAGYAAFVTYVALR
jgi:cation:H+ antiporter